MVRTVVLRWLMFSEDLFLCTPIKFKACGQYYKKHFVVTSARPEVLSSAAIV
jgi:hypothetical protein